MSYYIIGNSQNFLIKPKNYAAAYNALCNLNKRDDLKLDRSFNDTLTPKPKKSPSLAKYSDISFTNLAWNYDEICDTLYDILYYLHFEPKMNNQGIYQLHFDDKQKEEIHFLKTLAPYVENNSVINFVGEDDWHWQLTFQNGKIIQTEKQINKTYQEYNPY